MHNDFTESNKGTSNRFMAIFMANVCDHSAPPEYFIVCDKINRLINKPLMIRYRPPAQYGRRVLFLKCAVTVRVRDRVKFKF